MIYYFFLSVNTKKHGVGISFGNTQRLPEMKNRSCNSVILVDPLQPRIFYHSMVCRDPGKCSPVSWHRTAISIDFWARGSNLCLNWSLWIKLNSLVNITNIRIGTYIVNNLTFSSSKWCPKFVRSVIIAAVSVMKSHINFRKFSARWNGRSVLLRIQRYTYMQNRIFQCATTGI